MIRLTIDKRFHARQLAIALLVVLALVHVGLSLGTSLKTRNGPAGSLGFPPQPLALTPEQRRLGFMRDPYVFIQAIKSSTSEDSIIAVPNIYEGEFVEIVGRYYLYPRRLMRMPPEEAIRAGATHVISSSGVEIDGARPLTTVSGEFALYELPSR
ncbi:MAG: hypothetical protein QF609_00640 [Gammaproteobacteria bacterium]|nr:hypothetical protein [Gammaproteobacteria bacterium]